MPKFLAPIAAPVLSAATNIASTRTISVGSILGLPIIKDWFSATFVLGDRNATTCQVNESNLLINAQMDLFNLCHISIQTDEIDVSSFSQIPSAIDSDSI